MEGLKAEHGLVFVMLAMAAFLPLSSANSEGKVFPVLVALNLEAQCSRVGFEDLLSPRVQGIQPPIYRKQIV